MVRSVPAGGGAGPQQAGGRPVPPAGGGEVQGARQAVQFPAPTRRQAALQGLQRSGQEVSQPS